MPYPEDAVPPVHVLLVSASAELRRSLRDRLSHQRWSIREAESGAHALEELMQAEPDVLLLDTRLPDLRPAEFSNLVRTQFPHLQMLTINAPTGMQMPPEVASPKPGAFSGRPTMESTTPNRLLAELNELLHLPSPTLRPPPEPASVLAGSRSRSSVLSSGLPGWQGMVGGSAAMQRVYHAARLVARRDTSVLVTGESGTGKDLVARAVHVVSPREKQPFVVINCAAIPEALLEAELFGYTKGAFTGAVQSRIGRIHAAHGGTLFLDEIGDMPFPLQSKLLRFLEQGEVQRIGGSDTLKVDVRVIAATNADLKKLSSQSLFREDLYYRLAVFPIQIPPLRERMEDLDSLIESFLARFAPGVGLSAAARDVLHAHTWPGNVRELRNVLERASLFAETAEAIRGEDIVL